MPQLLRMDVGSRKIVKCISSVLYAQQIKKQGKHIIDFMILEYDQNGLFQGRLDGENAILETVIDMNNTQITPKFGSASFKENYTTPI